MGKGGKFINLYYITVIALKPWLYQTKMVTFKKHTHTLIHIYISHERKLVHRKDFYFKYRKSC